MCKMDAAIRSRSVILLPSVTVLKRQLLNKGLTLLLCTGVRLGQSLFSSANANVGNIGLRKGRTVAMAGFNQETLN